MALALTALSGSIIALLTLASYFIGHYFEYGTFDISQVITNPEAGVEGMTMAFLTLSMVEMFHSFNMRSLRGSIFKLPVKTFGCGVPLLCL